MPAGNMAPVGTGPIQRSATRGSARPEFEPTRVARYSSSESRLMVFLAAASSTEKWSKTSRMLTWRGPVTRVDRVTPSSRPKGQKPPPPLGRVPGAPRILALRVKGGAVRWLSARQSWIQARVASPKALRTRASFSAWGRSWLSSTARVAMRVAANSRVMVQGSTRVMSPTMTAS